MNLYAYVGNDPVNNVDPTGLEYEAIEPVEVKGEREDPWAALAKYLLLAQIREMDSGGGPRIRDDAREPQSAKDYGRCLANVRNFVNAHSQDAQTLADSLGNGVTAAEVLAVAGNETGYGGGHASFGNFFGLHGNGPAGTYYTTQNHTPVQMFPVSNGFLLSGQVFVQNVQSYMQPNMGSNPLQFFTILNHHGYATGNSDYPSYMVASGKSRGPYTMVMACTTGG